MGAIIAILLLRELDTKTGIYSHFEHETDQRGTCVVLKSKNAFINLSKSEKWFVALKIRIY